MFDSHKQSIGLDISDFSIEATVLHRVGDKIEATNQARIILDSGIVKRGRIKNIKKLADALKELFGKLGIAVAEAENVVFGLPEAQVYCHVFSVAANSSEEIKRAVISEIESLIPLKKEKIYYTHLVRGNRAVSSKEKGINEKNVLVVATDYQVFTEWKLFFQKIKLKVRLFDVEALAIYRGIFPELPAEPICVFDIGANTSSLSVFTGQGLSYSCVIQYAGNYFTKKIAQAAKTDEASAEELKIKYGLSANNKKPVSQALNTCLEHLNTELKRNLGYLYERYGVRVKKLVLVGGSSNLPGLYEYFQNSETVPQIELGQPRYYHNQPDRVFIESVGLAVRGLNSDWSKTDPVFSAEKSTGISANKLSLFKKLPTYTTGAIKAWRFKARALAGVVFGLLAVLLAGYFINIIYIEKKASESTLSDLHLNMYSVPFQFPLIVNRLLEEDVIPARLISDTITEAMEWPQALNQSRQTASQKLKESEKLWPAPVNQPVGTDSLIFPLELNWLVYSELDLGKMFTEFMDKRQGQTDIIVKQFRVQTLEKATEQDSYIIKGEVDFETKLPISVSNVVAIVTAKEAVAKIKVKQIGTPLNVRSGPSTSDPVVTTVNPGDEYEFLGDKNLWAEIKLDDNSTGWVFKQYIDILDNK